MPQQPLVAILPRGAQIPRRGGTIRPSSRTPPDSVCTVLKLAGPRQLSLRALRNAPDKSYCAARAGHPRRGRPPANHTRPPALPQTGLFTGALILAGYNGYLTLMANPDDPQAAGLTIAPPFAGAPTPPPTTCRARAPLRPPAREPARLPPLLTPPSPPSPRRASPRASRRSARLPRAPRSPPRQSPAARQIAPPPPPLPAAVLLIASFLVYRFVVRKPVRLEDLDSN